MRTHTVSADPDVRGNILLKDGRELVTTIWIWDIQSIHNKDGVTQITIRGTGRLWHATSASVRDVHAAVVQAQTLWYASKHRRVA
jgi:hypothetical protein